MENLHFTDKNTKDFNPALQNSLLQNDAQKIDSKRDTSFQHRESESATTQSQEAINSARALYYDFFAGFFLYELIAKRFELFNKQIEVLSQAPLSDEDLQSFVMLKNHLSNTTAQEIAREYSVAFNIPFNTGKTPPLVKGQKARSFGNPQTFLYLSHYVEGCLNGESLVKAKMLTKKTTFRLNEEFKESEEHFGFLLMLMRHLLQDSQNTQANEIFKECLKPMAMPIALSLQKRDDLPCFSLVGALLKNFITMEEHING